MKVSKMFPKKYAVGEDLQGKAVSLTIARITREKVYRPTEQKEVDAWVLYFEETHKGIVLGPTLGGEIEKATGQDDTDHWPGQKVTLYTEPKNVFGQTRQVFHARKANGGAPPPPALVADDDEDPDTF